MAVVAMKILDRFVIASSPCRRVGAAGLIDAISERMMARAPRPAKQSHDNERVLRNAWTAACGAASHHEHSGAQQYGFD
jgi:hypothetical protein